MPAWTVHPFKTPRPLNPLCLSRVFSHLCNFIYTLEKYNVGLASVIEVDIKEFAMVDLELSG